MIESNRIKLASGLEAHYLAAGDPDGPPLVLLHGYPVSAQLWRHCMPELAEGHRVLAPDLPGHGDSDKPDVEYDLDLFVGFVEGFLDAMQLQTVALVAHDLGGMAGLGFAARFPHRVSRLVVMDTAPYVKWPLINRLVVALVRSPRFSRQMLTHGGFRRALRLFCVRDRAVITPEVVEMYRTPWTRSETERRMLRQVIAMPAHRLTEPRRNFARLTMPTLVLWAEKDLVLPARLARRLVRDLPNATLRIVPDCGHFLQEERPREVSRHLREFLGQELAEVLAVAS